MRCLFFLLSWFCLVLPAVAQRDSLPSLDNRRVQQIWQQGDTLRLDTALIAPQSLRIYALKADQYISDTSYQVIDNQIIFNKTLQDSLFIHYRTLPYALHQPLLRKPRSLIGNAPIVGEDRILGGGGQIYQIGGRNGDDALDFEGLNYSGTFARGISMGNNQDLILNSSLNMQLSGKLGDVEVVGAITDNQVPLQPQGNTQQIQDFDRLFLQFKLQNNSLIAGDYDLKKPTYSYFTNYFRRAQGAQLLLAIPISQQTEIQGGGSFAISRGKFARNVFNGEEGNQGPYRLKGSSGERFLIILAGTERVFIDGILLTRGADQDYIMDYNQGEIKFTNKQLITKDKRIVIEFSYSDLTYLRTIYTAQAAVVNKRFSWNVQLYSEQDAKNQSSTSTLSDTAKAVLLAVGDDLDRAYIPGIDLATDESSDPIRYKLIDTLINGLLYDSVLVYTTHPDSGLYTARFSQPANGKGNYLRTVASANGTVYRWVAPDPLTGEPRGTHEPIVRLNTPRKQQLIETGASYNIGKQGVIRANFAASNNDLNTFSKVSNGDNWGWAARLTYEQGIDLGRRDSSMPDSVRCRRAHRLEWRAHYEHLDPRFAFVEPYRPREFQRDWNIGANASASREQLFWAQLALKSRGWGQVQYEASGLARDSSYLGWKQALNANVLHRGLQLDLWASWLQARTNSERQQFLRPRLDLSYTIKPLKNWKWGFYAESEYNRRLSEETDTLLKTSFLFHIWRIYTELPSTGAVRCSLSAQRRYDYSALPDRFAVNAVADEIVFAGNWNPQAKEKAGRDPRKGVQLQSDLLWNFHYRNLRIPDSSLTTLQPKETYLGRLEYRLNLFRNFVRWTTSYELGSGQQQKIEYNYVEVDKGQGVYQWIDRNDDGVQQQNEFETAVFQDQAAFIRVVLFTGEFIRSNNVIFNQNLDLDGQSLVKSSKADSSRRAKVARFFGRFASRSTFQIERKTLANADVSPFNPFQLDVADTALVSVSSGIRNTVFFNRSNPKFSVEIGQSDDRSKMLLTGGFETRERTEYSLFLRWSIGKLWSGQVQGIVGSRVQGSEFFPERNYQLRVYRSSPQFTFLTKNRLFRIVLKYNFKHLQNRIGAEELAQSHDITTEWKFTPPKTNLSASFSWIAMNYTGATNTPIEFAMTEGLKDGQNFLWSLSFSRYLSKDNKIQLFLNYEGRKTGDSRVIHTGRMQIRASF